MDHCWRSCVGLPALSTVTNAYPSVGRHTAHDIYDVVIGIEPGYNRSCCRLAYIQNLDNSYFTLFTEVPVCAGFESKHLSEDSNFYDGLSIAERAS